MLIRSIQSSKLLTITMMISFTTRSKPTNKTMIKDINTRIGSTSTNGKMLRAVKMRTSAMTNKLLTAMMKSCLSATHGRTRIP